MSLPQSSLEQAEAFLFDWVRPRAQELDASSSALKAALDEQASRGLLGLRVSPEFGGHGLDDRSFRRFQETCARCSGVLAFLQTQHQSACGFLAKSSNENLKKRTLPGLASGALRAGIAFSQLRRSGPPLLSAQATAGGYLLSGTAPWVTGWGMFGHCVTAASLPTGESLFVWHSLEETKELAASPIMRLASMETAQTVSCRFENLFVSDDDVLYVQPGDWIQHNDMLNIALQSPFALGCAQAGLDCLRDAYAKKKLDAIDKTADALQRELDKCREEAYAVMDDREDSDRSLHARAWAIELAVRCAHAAIAAHSGAANSVDHAAQRIYREALVFTVSAQTAAIMEATLERLV